MDISSKKNAVRVSSMPAIPAAIAISLAVAITGASCALEREMVSVWGASAETPKLASLSPVGPCELVGTFSSPVSVREARCVPETGGGEPSSVTIADPAPAREVRFILPVPLATGARAVLSGTVEDARGNTLAFAVPFIGYNSRVPRLLVNEIRTGYDKPKVEYVELVSLDDGNLAGVEIHNAMNETVPRYVFPAAEVRAGDFIVLHLRSVEEGLVDETGAPDESGGVDARPTARDFWDTQTRAPLKATNVITVRARAGGEILDALLVAEPGQEDWPNDRLSRAAAEAVACGAWGPTALVGDAASAAYPETMTTTRTLGRNPASGDANAATDWRVCKTGGNSPGSANATVP